MTERRQPIGRLNTKRMRVTLTGTLAALGVTLLLAFGSAGAPAIVNAADPGSTATPGKNEAASATPETGAQDGELTPTVPPGWGGWEVRALGDLARAIGWPQVVKSDTTGRLSVQQAESLDTWSVAFVKPFQYEAGAAAAFDGEQQDARLSGYTLTSSSFYSYNAYTAILYDGSGRVMDLRFHWLAQSWIMGVDLHGTNDRPPDPSLVAEQLLAAAIAAGLTPPQGIEVPTPISTPGEPPAALSPTPCGITFSDVPAGMWAYDYISELACTEVISGYADGSFRPQNAASRAQFVKMVVRSEGWNLLQPSTPSFNDVSAEHIFYPYVETAYAHGIISGYEDGDFHPNAYVTRAQVAKMLVRARGWTLDAQAPVQLCDVDANHWAWPYVQVAISRGIFTGYGDGCFRPDALTTRAQLSKVLVLAHQP